MTDKQLYNISVKVIKILNSLKIPDKAAVIFDIDDTLLDKNGNPIYHTVNIFNYVKMMGIKPIIVTNREYSFESLKYTTEQLLKAGITGVDLLYFRDPSETNPWTAKLSMRKCIYNNGYNVILSIGDMPWDIGKYGGIGIIVPVK
jgi:predicted secreted acid phosphatase